MSIFQVAPITVNIEALRTGIAWAQSWTPDSALLCTLGHRKMQITAVDEKQFLATWTYPLASAPKKPTFFLLPRFITQALTSSSAWDATQAEIMVHKNLVGIIVHENRQEYRLQWRWTAADFDAPSVFRRMIHVPRNVIHSSYVAVADAVHLSLANMLNPSVEDPDKPGPEAMLVDFQPSIINIAGAPIAESTQTRYYFNSRMLVRGLEIARENEIGFAVDPIKQGDEAILYLTCKRKDWQIHCALLSMGAKTQQDMPIMAVKQTREPVFAGGWLRN